MRTLSSVPRVPRLEMFHYILKAWQLFTSRPEEEQNMILTSSQRGPGARPQEKKEDKEGGREEETAESCFRRIDRHIRMMLKHKKHLPSVSLHDVLQWFRVRILPFCRNFCRGWRMSLLSFSQLIIIC